METLQQRALDWHRGRVEASEYALEKLLNEAKAEASQLKRDADKILASECNSVLAHFVEQFNYTYAPNRYSDPRLQKLAKRFLALFAKLSANQRSYVSYKITNRLGDELNRCAQAR